MLKTRNRRGGTTPIAPLWVMCIPGNICAYLELVFQELSEICFLEMSLALGLNLGPGAICPKPKFDKFAIQPFYPNHGFCFHEI